MTQQETHAGPTPPVAPGTGVPSDRASAGWSPWLVAPVAGLAGALAVYLFGQDSAWPVLVGGVMTAVLATALGMAVGRLARGRGASLRWPVQAAVITLVVVAVAGYFRFERDAAFRTAFGASPPTGVRYVDIEHTDARESDRRLLILKFEAGRQAMDELVSGRKFSRDEKAVVRPGREAQAQRSLWMRAFARYGEAVVDRWKNRLPTTEPFIYHWQGMDRHTVGQQASVLWDEASGRAYVIHSSP